MKTKISNSIAAYVIRISLTFLWYFHMFLFSPDSISYSYYWVLRILCPWPGYHDWRRAARGGAAGRPRGSQFRQSFDLTQVLRLWSGAKLRAVAGRRQRSAPRRVCPPRPAPFHCRLPSAVCAAAPVGRVLDSSDGRSGESGPPAAAVRE